MRKPCFILFPALLALYSSPAASEELFVKETDLRYSLQYSELGASSIDLWGAEVRKGRIETLASTAGFSVLMGRSLPVFLKIDLYSTDGLLPTNLGSVRAEFSLDSLSVLLGIPKGWFPLLRLERTRFRGQGIVTSDSILFEREGLSLTPGATFSLGATTEAMLLSWQRESKHTGDYYYYSIGLVELKHLGINQDITGEFERPSEVEKTRSGRGIIIMVDGTALSYDVRLPLRGFVAIDEAVIFTPNVGGMIKAGYKLGLAADLNGLQLKAYYGGYFWKLVEWGVDVDFGIAETDFAQSIGVSVSKRWMR